MVLRMTTNAITAGHAGQSSAPTAAAPGSAATASCYNLAQREEARRTLAPPTIAEASIPAGVEPEFIAMPAPGKTCPYSGLQRGMLYSLLREGVIRSVTLRRPDTTRGRRLIVLSSLKAYLRKLDAEQNGKGAK
jgi:hypothetical protein